MSRYQNLDAWKTAMDLVLEVYKSTKKYPKEEQYALTSQIRRAVVSVPANIAEGMGRQYKKDTLQFLFVSRGSLYELETLINIAFMLGLSMQDEIDSIKFKIERTLQLLNGLIKYLQNSPLK